MHTDIHSYNAKQSTTDKKICDLLAEIIDANLPEAESKIWHGHPVWFVEGNPIVGYDKLKDSVRLMFWSGASFDEEGLQPGTGKFKDASARYNHPDEINKPELKRWLKKSK